MKRIQYYAFSFVVRILRFILFVLSIFVRKKKQKKGVALLPHYPVDWPGGNRTSAFQTLFVNDDIECNVFSAWGKKDIEAFLSTENVMIKYKIYYKILFRRMRFFIKLPDFEAVWVQRALVPMFPFKHAYFEKIAKKFNPNIVYDFYDADYESNYNLVFETVKYANKVTVASKFLYNKFIPVNKETHFIRFSVNDDSYIKREYDNDETPEIKIGWMGSPENAKQLVFIADQLKKIENDFQNVIFSFVCRKLPALGLERHEVLEWGMDGFDYFKWMGGLDIGIVPFIEQTDRVKAKISMKSLEFMVSGIAQVVSPFVHSDMMINGKSCLVADESEWYERISTMIKNKDLRMIFGQESNKIYYEFHKYGNVFLNLKSVLLNR